MTYCVIAECNCREKKAKLGKHLCRYTSINTFKKKISNILRNLFVDSFLTSFLASETSARTSFSMFFRYPEFTIFLLTLLQLVNCISIGSKNLLLPEFPSSESSSCKDVTKSSFWSHNPNKLSLSPRETKSKVT